METQNDLFKKIKLADVVLHLFIQEEQVDYLLLLTSKHELMLYTFKHSYFEVISRYTLSPTTPVAFSRGLYGEVLLLHSAGIYIWTVLQIKSKCQPQKVKIQFVTPPIKAFPIANEHLGVVCEKSMITLVNQGERFAFKHHPQLSFKQLLYDTINDTLLVLLPSQTNRFPYLFDRQQIALWSQQGKIESYIKFCQDYYESDEILPQSRRTMVFSAQQQMVYILARDQLIILQARKRGQDVTYVFSVRMKVGTKWGECPLFCELDCRSGRMVYIGRARIGQMIPCEYRLLPRSIKQKKESPINYAYFMTNSRMLLLAHDGPASCKVYMHHSEDFS